MKTLLPDSGVFSAVGRRHVKYNCASELVLKLRNKPKSYETAQHQSSGGGLSCSRREMSSNKI